MFFFRVTNSDITAFVYGHTVYIIIFLNLNSLESLGRTPAGRQNIVTAAMILAVIADYGNCGGSNAG